LLSAVSKVGVAGNTTVDSVVGEEARPVLVLEEDLEARVVLDDLPTALGEVILESIEVVDHLIGVVLG
jgi:hypothetical protein